MKFLAPFLTSAAFDNSICKKASTGDYMYVYVLIGKTLRITISYNARKPVSM